MKQNNHKSLQFYLDLFHGDKQKVEVLMWVKLAVHFLCSGFLFYSLHSYYQGKQAKAKHIYELFSLISRKNAAQLNQHYLETHSYFKACIDANRQEEKAEGVMLTKEKIEQKDDYIWELELMNKFEADTEKKAPEEFKFLDENPVGLKYLFLGLFVALNLINVYLLIRNSDIFKASEKMMLNIN